MCYCLHKGKKLGKKLSKEDISVFVEEKLVGEAEGIAPLSYVVLLE